MSCKRSTRRPCWANTSCACRRPCRSSIFQTGTGSTMTVEGSCGRPPRRHHHRAAPAIKGSAAYPRRVRTPRESRRAAAPAGVTPSGRGSVRRRRVWVRWAAAVTGRSATIRTRRCCWARRRIVTMGERRRQPRDIRGEFWRGRRITGITEGINLPFYSFADGRRTNWTRRRRRRATRQHRLRDAPRSRGATTHRAAGILLYIQATRERI